MAGEWLEDSGMMVGGWGDRQHGNVGEELIQVELTIHV